jgi:hypothetical protein
MALPRYRKVAGLFLALLLLPPEFRDGPINRPAFAKRQGLEILNAIAGIRMR